MDGELTQVEKARKMARFSTLHSVSAWLEGALGGWPRTEEEWATAYDLWMEEKRRTRRILP